MCSGFLAFMNGCVSKMTSVFTEDYGTVLREGKGVLKELTCSQLMMQRIRNGEDFMRFGAERSLGVGAQTRKTVSANLKGTK